MNYEEEHKKGMHSEFQCGCSLCDCERQISHLKSSFIEVKEYGYKHSGFGHSCAKIAEERLIEFEQVFE